MRERQYLIPTFIAACILLVVLFILGKVGALSFFTNTVQRTYFSVSQIFHTANDSNIAELQKENRLLQEEIAHMQSVVADNKALRDQFGQVSPVSKSLTPANVVGMPDTIPNVSFPNTLIIDLGKKQQAKIGNSVILNSSLIGVISSLGDNYSQVTLTTNQASSFSVKDSSTGAIGVAKGQGNGEILVGNVQLSDSLHIGDFIVTLGSQTINGQGVAGDLVLGKVVSVEKNPSSLFQSARVVPLVLFDRLSTVFVRL